MVSITVGITSILVYHGEGIWPTVTRLVSSLKVLLFGFYTLLVRWIDPLLQLIDHLNWATKEHANLSFPSLVNKGAILQAIHNFNSSKKLTERPFFSGGAVAKD